MTTVDDWGGTVDDDFETEWADVDAGETVDVDEGDDIGDVFGETLLGIAVSEASDFEGGCCNHSSISSWVGLYISGVLILSEGFVDRSIKGFRS